MILGGPKDRLIVSIPILLTSARRELHTPFALYNREFHLHEMSLVGAAVANFELFISSLFTNAIDCDTSNLTLTGTSINLDDAACESSTQSTVCPELTSDRASPSKIIKQHNLRWFHNHLPVKIYLNTLEGEPVFAESARGLSDALTLLGIPNKIVSHLLVDDDSLYILLFPYINMITVRHYILWNFEKNPLYGFPPGFKTNEFGYQSCSMLPVGYVRQALAVWGMHVHILIVKLHHFCC